MIANWLSPWRLPSEIGVDDSMRQAIVTHARNLYQQRPFGLRLRDGAFEGSLIVGWIAMFYLCVSNTGPGRPVWVGAAMPMGFMAGLYAIGWGGVRLRARPFVLQSLRDSGFAVCLKCGYLLAGHADNRPCPECGEQPWPTEFVAGDADREERDG